MKNLKKVLALVLAVVMIMGVVSVASAKTYKDADAEAFKNYADAIDALSSLKILDGFEDETFKADGTLTRAQAAKIVAIVHNAATNGRIQSDIADLYSNAQNPFVDCNTSWALPYINYCRITGLADGMTATTYAPKREVTGVQFLKLMLTTLNFNTAKEGYTGTGWDINVLNRANEIGLTAGLEDGWKAIAPIKRGEAAQVLYNALTAYLVEYGQKVKNNYVNDTTLGRYYNYSFISNEQVAKSGYTLGGKMGISITRATDDFRRPGYNWSYGSWAAFYMDKPLNSYTTAVSACTILKNDMGVSETSGKTVSLNGFYKGVTTGTDATTQASELKVNGKVADYTALNYFAVDGRKYAYRMIGTDADNQDGIILQHKADKSCQNVGGTNQNWWNAQFGGQGDLTQVFKTEDGWVITTIHTFLAEVTKVNKTNKYNHINGETSDLKVWVDMRDNEPVYAEKPFVAKNGIATTDYAVGTKVLVTLSLKKSEIENLADHERDGVVASIAAADSKTGKLTGASDLAYAESVSVDGTKYPAACRFVLGKDSAMKFANYNKNFTFYFDTYGNVIGCTEPTTAASYVVMNKIYAEHTGGDFVIKADLYDLDGKKIEAATIAQAGSFDGAKDGYDISGSYIDYTTTSYKASPYVFVNAKHNDGKLLNALYSYTLSDKGVYTLTWVGVTETDGFGRLDGKYTHTAKLAYIYDNTVNNTTAAVKLSESSKIVVKSVGGEWTSYTGYTALPALTAKYVDYVDNDGDGYADIVYLGNAVFAGDSITGWVTNWGRFNWANGYDLVTVYVEGEPVVVNVKNPLGTTDNNTPAQDLKVGMYTFEIGKDADGVAYATAYKRNADISGYVQLDTISADSTSITMKDTGEVIGLTGVAIYAVNADGTVTKADASIFVAGWDYIEYFKAGNRGSAPYAELYVIDKTLVDAGKLF